MGLLRFDSLLAFLAYAAVTIVHTWPLAARPSTHAVPNEDVYINTWTLAWVVRQALRDPLHLFDANIFQPHPLSLAYNESLLPQALQAAPVLWLGGPPLLAHNLVFLLTFPLAGLGAYLLAREVTGSRVGAFLAGLGFAFCTFRYDQVVHVQTLSVQWFPFVLLFLRRSLETGRLRHLTALALFSVLQALSSGYMAVLLAAMLAVALLFHAIVLKARGHLLRVCLALAMAGAVSAVAFMPYREIAKRHNLRRKPQEAAYWSAQPSSYLDPGRYAAWPHLRALAGRARTGEPLYPGLAVLVLGAGGLAAAVKGSPSARLMALLAATGFLLSLGPRVSVGPFEVLGPFELLRAVPGASMLRVPSRMGILAILGLDILAAMGWVLWVEGRRHARMAGVAVAAFMLVESFPAGLRAQIRPVPEAPPSAAWLAQAPRGLVLELPWNHPQESGLYSYWSTAHWQPMVNGYGGYDPGNFGLGLIGARWPTPYTARVMRENGIVYVIVHMDRLQPPQRDRIRAITELPEGVRLAAMVGYDWIYEIEREAGG